MVSKEYDVLVVGAGSAGTTAARFAARAGLKVCLVDTKPREKVGEKVCGDAVGGEIFSTTGIAPPQNEDLAWKVKGAKLVSPDRKSCIQMEDSSQAGYIVNRRAFGQRLLEEALSAGQVDFLDHTFARSFILAEGRVRGIRARTRAESASNIETEIRAKVTIDASGYHTPLRRCLQSPFIEQSINDQSDSILCYREIIDFDAAGDIDPDYITITLDQEQAPGGYLWHFPRSKNSLNVGIGVYPIFTKELKRRYTQHALEPVLKGRSYKIVAHGGGIVSVRRPIASLVEDGVMFVGDSAAQVNPLDGGGIDASIRAGWMAAKAATVACERGDYSKSCLWQYNAQFMQSTGAQYGALEILRLGLQSMSNDELDFGLSHHLVDGKDIIEIASKGGLQLGFWDTLGRAIRGIWKPDLLANLAYIQRKMGEMKTLYSRYPASPTDFQHWQQKMTRLLEETRKMLTPSNKLFTYDSSQKKRKNPVFYVV